MIGTADIRLEEMPFVFDGKTWILRCNMNVLADVQAAYDGGISQALSGDSPMESVLHFLSAMMNDYAEDMGWPERYTPRQLGRRLAQWMIPMSDIMGLVTRSIVPPDKRQPAAGTAPPAEETRDAQIAEVSAADTDDDFPDQPGN